MGDAPLQLGQASQRPQDLRPSAAGDDGTGDHRGDLGQREPTGPRSLQRRSGGPGIPAKQGVPQPVQRRRRVWFGQVVGCPTGVGQMLRDAGVDFRIVPAGLLCDVKCRRPHGLVVEGQPPGIVAGDQLPAEQPPGPGQRQSIWDTGQGLQVRRGQTRPGQRQRAQHQPGSGRVADQVCGPIQQPLGQFGIPRGQLGGLGHQQVGQRPVGVGAGGRSSLRAGIVRRVQPTQLGDRQSHPQTRPGPVGHYLQHWAGELPGALGAGPFASGHRSVGGGKRPHLDRLQAAHGQRLGLAGARRGGQEPRSSRRKRPHDLHGVAGVPGVQTVQAVDRDHRPGRQPRQRAGPPNQQFLAADRARLTRRREAGTLVDSGLGLRHGQAQLVGQQPDHVRGGRRARPCPDEYRGDRAIGRPCPVERGQQHRRLAHSRRARQHDTGGGGIRQSSVDLGQQVLAAHQHRPRLREQPCGRVVRGQFAALHRACLLHHDWAQQVDQRPGEQVEVLGFHGCRTATGAHDPRVVVEAPHPIGPPRRGPLHLAAQPLQAFPGRWVLLHPPVGHLATQRTHREHGLSVRVGGQRAVPEFQPGHAQRARAVLRQPRALR